ncbi:aldolase/citrate lyase family protein [Acidiphilium sp. PA]|uniref:HpcH/HpaI aldolase family protein n=1 Tax=Acidiphilium sp. PA TaxID=2871705 RepID=UPI0022431F75|nr:aldolase/citrate lyase family protein [Acidiphilium sp. PA]MCW8305828.1 aldolase/citrate lyase family protein [Acidiphilium sp. PA]
MSLTKIWAENRAVLNGWLAIPDGFASEIMARQGWDSLTVDLQHGVVDYGAAVRMLTAISTTDVVPIVRVPWIDPGIIMKSLDAGALGVICPMINSVEDAKVFANAMRYAPQGGRSYGPIRAGFVHGADYAKQANDLVTGFAMIETKQAVGVLDDILAVPGIDAVYIGPNDLALTLGMAPQFDPTHPTMMEAIEHILARAKHHGKRAAIHTGSAGYAKMMVGKGFDLVTVGSDSRFIAQGAAEAVAAFRATA